MSFETIVDFLTDEKRVYRNFFIEAIDPESTRDFVKPPPDERRPKLIPGMNKQMRDISPKERVNLVKKRDQEQKAHLIALNKQLDELNEKALTTELSVKDVHSMVQIGDQINQVELLMDREAWFKKNILEGGDGTYDGENPPIADDVGMSPPPELLATQQTDEAR
ncbi:hypothetical protein CMI37_33715 [Candidatus Pacearchaeota archaeon]|nr:hypothetical protein [Candidatus Pacearchaeota archaeon]|tara:strand:+ start:238 stop:732 length:495 start_codon:yes stop_codon:yes gene_type:complete